MKTICIGISAAISAMTIPSYILMLKAKYNNVKIKVIMTSNSQYFLSPGAVKHLPNVIVYESMTDLTDKGLSHISLVADLDLFIVSPATANFLGKAANGLADDILSLCYLSAECKKIILPAMNSAMYKNKAVCRNLEQVKTDGAHVLEPSVGLSAQSGDKGIGAICSPSKLISLIERLS